jgi:DNA-binding transcriptional LysR family regulator
MLYNDIFLFIRLIKAGSFTALSEQSNISQATVSRKIKNLEESLKASLIIRDSRNLLEMTIKGQELFDSFSGLEVQANNSLQNMINKIEDVEGVLYLTTPKIFFDNILLPKLDLLYEQYPNIKIVVSYYGGDVSFFKSKYDIAISTYRPTMQNSVIRFLIKGKRKLYATQKYINKYGEPESLDDLLNHNVIGFAKDNQINNEINAYDEQTHKVSTIKYNPRLVFNNANCDVNVAINSETIISDLNILARSNKLNIILNNYYFGEDSFYIIRNNNVKSNLEKVFIKFLDDCLVDYI